MCKDDDPSREGDKYLICQFGNKLHSDYQNIDGLKELIVPGMDLKPLSSSITKSGKSHDALFHNSIKQEDEDCKIANVLDNIKQKKETR